MKQVAPENTDVEKGVTGTATKKKNFPKKDLLCVFTLFQLKVFFL